MRLCLAKQDKGKADTLAHPKPTNCDVSDIAEALSVSSCISHHHLRCITAVGWPTESLGYRSVIYVAAARGAPSFGFRRTVACC